MATPVLNNGIFLRDTNYKASSHVDSYHLTQMLGNTEPMDMGPVDIWAMTLKVDLKCLFIKWHLLVERIQFL